MLRLQNIKTVISQYSHGECGLHDIISAKSAMLDLNNTELFCKLMEYANGVAVGDKYPWHHEEIEPLLNGGKDRSLDVMRIYIWIMDNLYAREILKIITEKQQATKLLRQI